MFMLQLMDGVYFKTDLEYVGVEDNKLVREENQNELQLSIYPNPAVDDVTLSLDITGIK